MSNPTLAELSDYQKQVFDAIGYKQATDYDTGNTYWTDSHNGGEDAGLSTRLQTPGNSTPDELLANYLAGFDPRHGTAGYVDAGPKLPNGYTSVDPSIQNAFREFVSLNGKNYIRSDSSYGGLTYDEVRGSHSSIPGLMDKYGITPDMFVEDPTFGKMIEDNPRTSAFIRGAHAKTQPQTFMDSFLTSMPLVMGSFGMGALAAPAAAAALGVPTSAAQSGLGMIPSLLQGKAPGAGSLLGLLGSLGGGLSGIGDSIGNTAGDFGNWLKSFFSGDGATGATASSAGGSVGGGFGGGMGDEFNFDDIFGDGAWEPSNPIGNFIGDGPGEGGVQFSNPGSDSQYQEDDNINGSRDTSGSGFSDSWDNGINSPIAGGTGSSGSDMLGKVMKLLFGAGAGGAAAGGGGGGSNGGQRGLLEQLLGGANGGNSNNGLLGLIGAIMQSGAFKDAADQYSKAGVEAARLADPFRDQRPKYQGLLAQSYDDPNFFQNNSTFKGITDLAGRQAQATAASQGFNMSGNAPMEVGRAVTDAGLKYALPFQAQLAGNAGAGFGPGYSGFLSQQGANMATQAGMGRQGANMNGIAQGAGLLGQIGNLFV
jgi:hypothetical protein